MKKESYVLTHGRNLKFFYNLENCFCASNKVSSDIKKLFIEFIVSVNILGKEYPVGMVRKY